jgi:hypothetical protein
MIEQGPCFVSISFSNLIGYRLEQGIDIRQWISVVKSVEPHSLVATQGQLINNKIEIVVVHPCISYQIR